MRLIGLHWYWLGDHNIKRAGNLTLVRGHLNTSSLPPPPPPCAYPCIAGFLFTRYNEFIVCRDLHVVSAWLKSRLPIRMYYVSRQRWVPLWPCIVHCAGWCIHCAWQYPGAGRVFTVPVVWGRSETFKVSKRCLCLCHIYAWERLYLIEWDQLISICNLFRMGCTLLYVLCSFIIDNGN